MMEPLSVHRDKVEETSSTARLRAILLVPGSLGYSGSPSDSV